MFLEGIVGGFLFPLARLNGVKWRRFKKIYIQKGGIKLLNNLVVSFEAVFPLLVFLMIGYILRKKNVFGDEFVRVGTRLTYFITLPLLLFVSVYESKVLDDLNGTLVILVPIVYIVLFILLWISAKTLPISHQDKGAMVVTLLRTNALIVGLPVIISIFGVETSGIVTLAIASTVPFGSLFGVLILSLYGPKESKKSGWIIAKDVVLHPLLLATLLGLLFLILNWQVPSFMLKPMKDISSLSTPLALMALGADFSFKKDLKVDPLLGSILGFKLVVIPLLIVIGFSLLGFRGVELLAPFTLFAAPSAVSNYAMTVEMKSNSKLAGKAIIISTMFSPISLFLFIFIMKTIGLI